MAKLIVWTPELVAAVRAIRDDKTPPPYWPETFADIQFRADEMCAMRAGQTLTAYQAEYVQTLRSRAAGFIPRIATCEAFESAWAAAYSLANA